MRDSCVISYWIDTLVLKNWGKYLRYFTASPFPLQGKNQRSAQEVALAPAKKPTFLPARMILPAGGGGVAGALRAVDVDPMKELVDKDVVVADSQPQLLQHRTNDDKSVSVCRD